MTRRHARSRERVIAVATALTLLAGTLSLAACSDAGLPSLDRQLKGTDQTTVIHAADGSVLARIHGGQDRTDVKLDTMPRTLRDAVVATEDRRFYEHEGVDPLSILRALWSDISGGSVQGGSTITQQYVKNAWLSSERTLDRKVDEARLAMELEQKLTKDQILERYLNTIYFGHGAWGVASAARVYFGTIPEKLDLAQSAMIAGVIRSPRRYSPYLDPVAAKARRDLVLGLMLEQGLISQAEHDAALPRPLSVAGLSRTSGAGAAPWFVEWVRTQLVERFGASMALRGGLVVRTTLDPKAQRAAEQAVSSVLDRPDDPSAALVAIQPGTGAVRALVGGRDPARERFDVAVDGRRQPGSAFKPFVLATSLAQGVSPRERFDPDSATLSLPGGGSWKVSGPGGGSVSLVTATQRSINPVFARLVLRVGADKVAAMARTLGITSDVEAVPAIALGGLEHGVSPLEMANAYATLAADGRRAAPYAIESVGSSDGSVLFTAKPVAERAIPAPLAWLVTDILRGVITGGTGTGADIGRPAAGKTGTTQRNSDAWFVGYVPQLAASVWVGYPDAMRSMSDVHGGTVTGGSLPARIWKQFMAAATKDVPALDFERPDGVARVEYCVASGDRATGSCPRTAGGWFLADPALPECKIHGDTLVGVPDLEGMSRDAAQRALSAAGLKWRFRTSDASGTSEPGVVMDQAPPRGTRVPKGTAVTIGVSASASAGDTTKPGPRRPSFSFAPSAPNAGHDVRFSGRGAAGSRFTWDFGDGSSAEGASAVHAYPDPGDYSIVLTVIAPDGTRSEVEHGVVVR